MCIHQIPYKLHVTLSDKYHWPNFTCSLAHSDSCAVACLNQSKIINCAVEFVSVIEVSRLVTDPSQESMLDSIFAAIEARITCTVVYTHYSDNLLPSAALVG